MTDSLPSSLAESLPNRVGLGAVVLFVVLALGGVSVSLVFWILGVGMPRLTHNIMGILFVAINAACLVVGTRWLMRGRRLAAMVLSLADNASGRGDLITTQSCADGGWGRKHGHLGNSAPYTLGSSYAGGRSGL